MNKENINEILSAIDPLATVKPLNDTAFKLLLKYYDEIFNELTLYSTGKEAGTTIVNAIGSEACVYVGGKTSFFDHLRNTISGYIDFEGQNDRSKFPIQRHLFCWALIFVCQLKEGEDYIKVTPVTVIVFYKDRGKSKPLIQKANVTGDLFADEDTQYFNLIAVNTAKWFEADNQKFKHYLALLHLGLDEDVLSENGIDVTDTNFQQLRNKLMRCCAQYKLDIAKKEGDEEMKKMMAEYLREEGRVEGIIKVYYDEMKLSFEEIAEKMNIPLNKVVETIATLQTAM